MQEIDLREGESHLSRTVTEQLADGREKHHRLTLVSLRGGRVELAPFTRETPGTTYHDGPLLLKADGRLYAL